jgi:hypothetical protein
MRPVRAVLLLLALVGRPATGEAWEALEAPDESGARRTSVGAPIYNGTPTQAFPAVVGVVVINQGGTTGLCSGTLVTPAVVLTAGHCLAFGIRGAEVVIFPDGVTEIDRRAVAYAIHPRFNLSIVAFADVGLLVLESPVAEVAPLPLVMAAPRRRVRGTIVGFGDDGPSGAGLKRMGTVRLTRCPRAVPKVGIFPGQLSTSLCWRPRRRGQDTCHGDSGGPLLINGAVAGVTSGGFPGCPGRLSWDTSVAAVRSWLDQKIAEAETITPTSP